MTATIELQFCSATDRAQERCAVLREIRFKSIWYFFVLGSLAAPIAARGSLSFDGTNQYVTFGSATSLGSSSFTIETWFNWSGGGVAVSTGNGGLTAIPLLTKMSAEFDGDNRDGNYFFGIRPGDHKLVADLEEGASGESPGKNHPVAGVTAVTPNAWHHAAATYDGTNWALLLDGHLEITRPVGQPPRWDSIQHAALASSLSSTGAPKGFFAGMLDEVRIWNYARSASQVASNRYVQIVSARGLLGRWPLDETGGLIAHDSSGHGVHGTLVNGPIWRSNERAPADVFTRMKLDPINPERTAALRRTEAQRAPPIFRFDPAVSDQVEKVFRTNFLLTREQFLAALEEALRRWQADPEAASDDQFAEFVNAFQSRNKGFPVDLPLARMWANRQTDAGIQTEMLARLRLIMSRYICADLLPNEAKFGPPTVRVYTSGFSNAAPEIEAVQARSLSCSRTNLCPLGKARNDARQGFSTNTEAAAIYVGSLLRENCLFDAELTHQSRARYAESLFAAEHYEPGQMLVKKGQIIDAGVRAALDELKKQTAAEELKARAATEQLKAENMVQELKQRTAVSEFKSQYFSQQNRWLFGGLLAVAITSSIAVWQLARPRRRETLLPVPVRSLDDDPSGDLNPAQWRERALRAEQQAAQASAAVRAGLLSHLADWLKQKLLRRLIADRAHLLNTQENAEQELAELEARLAKLHAPMEERLGVYRQRIVELERELAAKGQENREIIQAKIQLTRKRLEAEQERGSVET